MNEIKIDFFNPPTLPKIPGFTQLVKVTMGRQIFISGQVPLNAQGAIVGIGNWELQTEQVFSNINEALKTVNASFNQVVKLNYYMTDISKLPVIREIRDKYINVNNPPASTAVEVNKLFMAEILLEIDAIAVV